VSVKDVPAAALSVNELVEPLNVTPVTDSPARSSVLVVFAPVSSKVSESPLAAGYSDSS
jgi:hypothetical protein